MNSTLPAGLSSMFSVKQIGRVYAAICQRCGYRCNFMHFPVTASMSAKLARHVEYHHTYDVDLVCARQELRRLAYDGPGS